MPPEVAVPSGRPEPVGRENRLDIARLPRPDLDQHMAPSIQMHAGTGCDGAIGVEAVGPS